MSETSKTIAETGEAGANEPVVATMPKQPQETRLKKYKKVCHKWLYIEDDEYIDVVFGVVLANRLDAKPVWLYLVAPPGGGKTEIVQSFDGHPEIYSLSTLTANTLLSGKIQEPKEADPSLLPKLDGKVLVIKDFTIMLKGKHEAIQEVFAQLRDAYDGKSRKVYGTGKAKEYKSKFGVIAAVTNDIDKYLGLLSSLGERFVTYRMAKLSDVEIDARTDMASQNNPVKTQEEEMRKAAQHVLNLDVKPATISTELRKKLGSVAKFIAKARTGIKRERYTKEIETLPDSEVPTRLVKQFVSLAQGIAMARERQKVTEDEVRLVSKMAIGSLPSIRMEIVRRLIEVHPKWARTDHIVDQVRLGSGTIRRSLEDLHLLEILDRSTEKNGNIICYTWKVNDRYTDLLLKVGI